MTAEDWIPFDWTEEEWHRDDTSNPITCKYCNETGLHWEKTEKGWRLFEDEGQMHSCRLVTK